MLILNGNTFFNRMSFNFSACFVFVDSILGSSALSLAPAVLLGKNGEPVGKKRKPPGKNLKPLGKNQKPLGKNKTPCEL